MAIHFLDFVLFHKTIINLVIYVGGNKGTIRTIVTTLNRFVLLLENPKKRGNTRKSRTKYHVCRITYCFLISYLNFWDLTWSVNTLNTIWYCDWSDKWQVRLNILSKFFCRSCIYPSNSMSIYSFDPLHFDYWFLRKYFLIFSRENLTLILATKL